MSQDLKEPLDFTRGGKIGIHRGAQASYSEDLISHTLESSVVSLRVKGLGMWGMDDALRTVERNVKDERKELG